VHDGTGNFLAQHHIVGIWDTRNNPAVVSHLQHTHQAFTKTDPRNSPGSGAVVLIAKPLLSKVQFLGFHASIPLAWVRVYDIVVGLLYARYSLITHSVNGQPTDNMQLQTQFLAALHSDVSAHQAAGSRVVLMGDFNARIGALSDGFDAPRLHEGPHNQFGSLLMTWAQAAELATLTGRLDVCEHSWQRGTQSSRIDHAFITPCLFDSVTSWNVINDFYGSDHKPMCLTIRTVATPPARPQPALSWDFHMQHSYSQHLSQQSDTFIRIHEALDSMDIAKAHDMVCDMVWCAASATGLVRTRRSGSRPRALPFGEDALAVLADIRTHRKQGIPVPHGLRKLWRMHVRSARHHHAKQQHQRMRHLLKQHPRIFWSNLNHSAVRSSASGILPTSAWQTYFATKFGNSPPTAYTPHPIPTSTDCMLMRPVTNLDVALAFKQLGTSKAVGADGIPAEFITKPHTHTTGPLFLQVMVHMCNVVLQLGHVPDCWKTKLLSPVFKTGTRSDPSNYRPIAVATTFYRLFTAVFARRLTAYLHFQTGPTRLLDSQFAFRKGVSTDQAHMVLTTCCDAALARDEPLALVKLDISKAYDTVHRAKLWDTLRRDEFPASFIALMQELYRDTPYAVKVNGEVSAEFYPDTGLLQGCSLSPALYNEYLRDCLQDIEQQCAHMGIRLHGDGMKCVQVDFADDIHGTVALQHVAAFLQVVRTALAKKEQHLNMGKCKILVIDKEPYSSTNIHGIPVVHQLRILGLLYSHNGSVDATLHERMAKGATKAVLHISRLTKCGCHHDLEIASIMVKQDIRPTLLFGAGIWGHRHLAYADPMKHILQKPYSVLQRLALNQPHFTAHWTVTLMSGLMPVQHWIIRDFCRFWNRMLASCDTNQLVAACMQLQLHLFQQRKPCWLRKWHDALRRLLPGSAAHEQLAQLLCVQEGDVMGALLAKYLTVLRAMGNPFDSQACRHRKIAFSWHVLGCVATFSWQRVPRIVAAPLPDIVRTSWLRMLAGNAFIPARHYTHTVVHYSQRLCSKCTMAEVADESHVLLRCPATSHVRQRVRSQLLWPQQLVAFLHNNRSAWSTVAHFVYYAMVAYQLAPTADLDDMPLHQRRLLLHQRLLPS